MTAENSNEKSAIDNDAAITSDEHVDRVEAVRRVMVSYGITEEDLQQEFLKIIFDQAEE